MKYLPIPQKTENGNLSTGGNRNDIIKAEALTEDIKSTTVIANKGYDSKKFRDYLDDQQIVIPPRRNRKIQYQYDKNIYMERHLIECFLFQTGVFSF